MKRAGGQGSRSGPLLLLFGAVLIAVAGCSNNPLAVDDVRLPDASDPAPNRIESELLAAPDSIEADGIWIRPSSGAWRDFMPGQTDDRLRVHVLIVNQAGDAMPTSATPTFAWVIHNHEIWGVRLSPSYTNNGSAVAWGGPRWEIGDTVQVVAGIRDSSGVIDLVRCNDALIIKTT